jgi:hypothetical protein
MFQRNLLLPSSERRATLTMEMECSSERLLTIYQNIRHIPSDQRQANVSLKGQMERYMHFVVTYYVNMEVSVFLRMFKINENRCFSKLYDKEY